MDPWSLLVSQSKLAEEPQFPSERLFLKLRWIPEEQHSKLTSSLHRHTHAYTQTCVHTLYTCITRYSVKMALQIVNFDFSPLIELEICILRNSSDVLDSSSEFQLPLNHVITEGAQASEHSLKLAHQAIQCAGGFHVSSVYRVFNLQWVGFTETLSQPGV